MSNKATAATPVISCNTRSAEIRGQEGEVCCRFSFGTSQFPQPLSGERKARLIPGKARQGMSLPSGRLGGISTMSAVALSSTFGQRCVARPSCQRTAGVDFGTECAVPGTEPVTVAKTCRFLADRTLLHLVFPLVFLFIYLIIFCCCLARFSWPSALGSELHAGGHATKPKVQPSKPQLK